MNVLDSMPRVAVVLPQSRVRLADDRLAMYFKSLIRGGASPFALPVTMDKDVLYFMISQADGLVISGGMDLEPVLYGGEREADGFYDPGYDRHGMLTFAAALERQMPILGICRGAQLINVACGGSLIIDVPGHRDTFHALHELSGRVAAAMGTENVTVNSFHHQVVDRPAAGFRVTARSPEGYAEAIEHETAPYIVGVQWHPERLSDAGTDALYRDFIQQCAVYRSGK